MKEFIEKLIGRFEENTIQHKEVVKVLNESGTKFVSADKVKEIVNELAEEYNNDFCEWQEKSAGGIELVREPHKQHLFHIEEERRFCPYCGKKIKIAPYQPKGE